MVDLRIANAHVVTPWGTELLGAVDIDGGIVTALSKRAAGSARRTIEADGKYLMPGFIDTHVHLNFFGDGEDDSREIGAETRAALRNGVTTTLIYFRQTEPYDTSLPTFLARAEAAAHTDFGVHLGILIDEHLEQIESLAATYGILSFKVYTTYKDGELRRFGVAGQDDGFILAVLRRVAKIGGAQLHVHAENDEIITRDTAQVASSLDRYANAIEAWSAARPPVAEAEAIRRITFLAREAGCPIFIPHVSGIAALDQIREARKAAGNALVRAETCPHYLLLSAEQPPPDPLGKINPPIRREADSRALVAALADGEIEVVGTDHATTTLAGKADRSVIDARPGFPGLATLVPAMHTLVRQGDLTLEQVARLAFRAGRLFNLPRKGLIAPGYDADLYVCDSVSSRLVRAAELGSLSDYSVFEGRDFSGWPETVVLRGAVVVDAGENVDQASGRYIPRTYQDA
jgi:dihydropyrimidinase